MMKYTAVITRNAFVDDNTGKDMDSVYFPEIVDHSTVPATGLTDDELVMTALYKAIDYNIQNRDHVFHGTTKTNEKTYEIDWQTELRIRISNWFIANNIRTFLNISEGYKFRTGLPLSVKVIEELFDTKQEIDLQLVFELINAFKIPFKVKSIEMELG